MALVTGSAFGTIQAQSEIYVEGAPNIYFSDISGSYRYSPDSDGFYWQLSGTATYPVYQLGCYEGVSLADNLDINSVRCDVVGDKDAIMRRNYLELRFTLKTFFPLKTVAPFFGRSPSDVTQNTSEGTEKFGIGSFDNSKYYKVYFPKVYDEATGDYVCVTGHRCKLILNGEISMTYGNVWTVPVIVRMMADESKPSAQLFATIVRADNSEI